MNSLSSTKPIVEEITRDQLELLKAKFDVLQGERKVSFLFIIIYNILITSMERKSSFVYVVDIL